jgi:hypothetical protein
MTATKVLLLLLFVKKFFAELAASARQRVVGLSGAMISLCSSHSSSRHLHPQFDNNTIDTILTFLRKVIY